MNARLAMVAVAVKEKECCTHPAATLVVEPRNPKSSVCTPGVLVR